MLSLFESGMLKIDGNLVITEVDSSILAIFECDSSCMVGRAFDSLVAPSDPKGAYLFHKRLSMYSGSPVDIYPLHILVEKRLYLCRARVTKEHDFWLILIEKIKSDGSIFHSLRFNELKFKSISSASSDGVALLSDANRLLEFNPSFFQIMNFRSKHGIALSEEALYLQDFFSWFESELATALLTRIKSCAESVKQDRFEVSGWFGKKYISVSMHALYLDTATYSGCTLVVRDRTSVKEIEKLSLEVEAQRIKSIEASKMAALGEMAGGIAHEINSPLATIRTLSSQLQELLGDDPLDKAYLTELGCEIEATTMRIAKIVAGLRSISRDASEDPFISVPARGIISDTLSLCSEKFKLRGINLIYDELPEQRLFLRCRPSEISQVFLNLLNNACDAVESLPDKWVRFSVRELDDKLEFSITDSGGGIPDQVMKKLFQPFFTTKDVGKGTGIGLGISKRIAESHGGVLFVDDECENTRFVIHVPKSPRAERECV